MYMFFISKQSQNLVCKKINIQPMLSDMRVFIYGQVTSNRWLVGLHIKRFVIAGGLNFDKR